MDNEKINLNQPSNPSNFSWKWIVIIVVAVAAIGLIWYFSRQFYVPEQYPSTAQKGAEAQSGALTAGDKTSDIAKDLNQLPNDTAANNELNSLDQNLKNF